MPVGQLERVLGVLGLLAVAALAALAVMSYLDYRETAPSAPRAVLPARNAGLDASPDRRVLGARFEREGATEVRTTRDERLPAPSRVAELVFTAARGDCWITVRSGSADGELVFAGTLEQGDTRSFTGRTLWVELGAPSYIDVRLNGKAVTDLPNATATVVFTPSGVRTLSTA